MMQRLVNAADRRVAAVSHVSIAFGVLIGVGFTLGIAINFAIWLRSKRSPMVEFHSAQAGTYQFIVLVTNIVLIALWIAGLFWVVGGPESGPPPLARFQIATVVWLALLPIEIVWFFGTILLGVYAGLKVGLGGEFSYPIIGAWVQRRMAKQELKRQGLRTG
jgi:uncharacterized Tic20 family protein